MPKRTDFTSYQQRVLITRSKRGMFVIINGCLTIIRKRVLRWYLHGEGNSRRAVQQLHPCLQTSGEYSIKLIISPVDGLLVDGFSAMSVRCVYSTQDITLTLPPGQNGVSALQIQYEDFRIIEMLTAFSGPQHDDGVVTGNGGAPLLSMQILDGHGISGPPLSRASVGQRITLDLALKNTAIYDFYVHSCYAHDGTNSPDASINIIDSNGYDFRTTVQNAARGIQNSSDVPFD
ncbi:unnamed protein product [Heligmosomoides polygyrus]|uniref:ZP domain-containing protein n=1 Tax=Heligmosomoides polygyrus TaxID=6339 RepID=A0A183FLU5_HELPZ|nr:unnamed protein product [Heligmosomoides polygyrus]